MKKVALIFIGIGLLFVFPLFIVYGIKNSNPYTLQIDEDYMEYKDIEYENLYQVSYGDIFNIINLDTNINKKNCNMYEIYVSSKVADKFYVGQYIENCKDNIFNNMIEENIRIIAIEDEGYKSKITYISSGKILVNLSIDEKYINKITEKSDFELVIDEQEFIYEVKSIGKEVLDGQFNIILEINDDEAMLRSGMTVNVKIIVEKKENVLCVPISCINTNDMGQSFVLQKNNEEYEMRVVKIGIVEGERVEVSGDIKEGDIIVDNE